MQAIQIRWQWLTKPAELTSERESVSSSSRTKRVSSRVDAHKDASVASLRGLWRILRLFAGASESASEVGNDGPIVKRVSRFPTTKRERKLHRPPRR